MNVSDWTYSGDPASSPMNEVRFLVQDTDSDNRLIADSEINYAVALVYGSNPPANGNYLPAAYVADAVAARYAHVADKAVGDLHISYSQRWKNYKELAAKLRNRANLAGVPVYAGGQSIVEKFGLDADPDRIAPAARIDGMNRVGDLNSSQLP